MKTLKDSCRIAVVQAEPVMFDKDACIDKAVRIIGECAGGGAELVVFPELFVPGYPFGMNFGFRTGSRSEDGRADWKRYYDNSILADGPDMQKIIDAAIEHGVYLSIGYSERDGVNGTLYNSNMMISPEGEALNHRKLKPTGSERVIWGDADRDYFPVMETPWGPMGNLICWESYMPLARVALYEKGIAFYISPNTNDNEEWQNTIRHIAIEGHCYFINCDMLIRKSSYPEDLKEYDALSDLPEIACRGGSCVIDPFGHLVSDCVWDKEEIIYADLDMQKVPASKMEHDVCGHYARPDVVSLCINDPEDQDAKAEDPQESAENHTYILLCSDGSLYTGWTNDLEKRIASHNNGTGGKYTRARRPVRLVYHETFATKQEAMSREWHIKQMSREEKEKLIAKGGVPLKKV